MKSIKDQIMDMPVRKALGLKIRFVHPVTNRVRIGIILSIERQHLEVLSNKRKSYCRIGHNAVKGIVK